MTDNGSLGEGPTADHPTAGPEFRIERLHHVQLAIPPGGEDVARRFYADLLGLAELPKPAELAARGGCWFGAGAVEIHLGVEPAFRPAAKAHPGIVVANLDALAGRLAAGGADVQWDDGFPGHRRFYTRDWHGNRLELLEPVRG